MGLFGAGAPTNLEQVLGQQADTKVSGIEDAYNQRKKRLVSKEAATGRLGSGVSNYDYGDLATGEAGDIGGVYSDLSSALGGIPTQDYLTQKDNARNLSLAQLIGGLNKPSTLQEALGALRGVGNIAATVAAFA